MPRWSRTLLFVALLVVVLVVLLAPRVLLRRGFETLSVSDARQLQEILSRPRSRTTIVLAPGVYHLSPTAAVDSTCGNCEDPDQQVPITVGVQVSGRHVWIVGPDEGKAVVHTHAGYGIFFKDCAECGIAGVTVTGGERDTARAATDAGIVAKDSRVSVLQNQIVDNIGDSTTVVKGVVGIMGVCGRENSFLWIRGNHIVRNSWDGIALYRDAEAEIEQNVVDGVDRARGGEAGGGRGVGIGVTWNARARISQNIVQRYWKGVGVFVDAHAVVQGNIVEEMLAWGIAYWDAGKGKPWAYIEDNIVYDCGACGVSITREAPFDAEEAPGGFVGNVVVKTGGNPKYDAADYYCYQCALALQAVPERFVIRDNLYFDNRRASEDLPDYDVDEAEFRRRLSRFVDDSMSSAPAWFWERSRFLEWYVPSKGD